MGHVRTIVRRAIGASTLDFGRTSRAKPDRPEAAEVVLCLHGTEPSNDIGRISKRGRLTCWFASRRRPTFTTTMWRFFLRHERQLHREEAVRLRHRGLRAVQHVVDELPAERELHVLAVDVAHAFRVGHEEVVRALAPRQIDVLPHLDIAVGAEYR